MTPRYAFAPLEDRLRLDLAVGRGVPPEEVSLGDVALRLGCDRRMTFRWRAVGLTTASADRLAILAGYLPHEVWPSWYDDAWEEPLCRWCGAAVSWDCSGSGAACCSDEHARLLRLERRELEARSAAWWRRVEGYSRAALDAERVPALTCP